MRKTRSKKGFTLVETMVALAILAIVSVVFVSMFSTMAGISMKTTDDKNTDAALAAEIATGELLDGYGKTALESSNFNIIHDGVTYSIPYAASKYTAEESNRSFTVLESPGA